MIEGSRLAKSLRSPWQWVGAGLILLVLAVITLAPLFERPGSHASPMLQSVRSINLLMLSYAADHNGKYPAGKSSTEVFQKLIDEKYVGDDVSFFYYEMQGKIKPTSNQLKPENVCFDITMPVDAHDSDYLPIVFLTGYRIQYLPNGNAVPIKASSYNLRGVAIAYKDNSAVFLKNDGLSDGIVSNVISQDFDPAGKKYTQLTPDGPLEQ